MYNQWSFRACKPQPKYPYSIARIVNVTLNIRYENDKKISNSSSPDVFFQAQNAPKPVFGRGCPPCPDPDAGELMTLPQEEMSMDLIHPWIGLDWIGLGRILENVA